MENKQETTSRKETMQKAKEAMKKEMSDYELERMLQLEETFTPFLKVSANMAASLAKKEMQGEELTEVEKTYLKDATPFIIRFTLDALLSGITSRRG